MSSTYVTRAGDTWDAIAYRALGSEMHLDLMLDANPEQNYVAAFDAGVVLTVPDVPAADLAASLPPWRVA
jgi:phage tail protein X